jgi:hypothetical protein
MGFLKTVSIGGREFPASSDGSSQRVLGGIENETAGNGDGSRRTIKKMVPWKYSGVVLAIDEDRSDMEYLKSIQNGDDTDFVFTEIGEISYQGTGNIEGPLQKDDATNSTTIECAGPGDPGLKKM